MLSKCSVNDKRKFVIIVVTVRLYNAGGRQVYHITKGCFQWGTCETVVGMGMGQHWMEIYFGSGLGSDQRSGNETVGYSNLTMMT
jgi:hypothetical protein